MTKVMEIVKLKQEIREREIELKKASSSYNVQQFLRSEIGEDARESFVVIGLNVKKEVNMYSVVFTGSLSTSVAAPRDVMQRLLLSNSDSFIIGHNHPSGDVTPSGKDREVTKKMKEAGEFLGILLLDHIIVSTRGYYSFLEEGEL